MMWRLPRVILTIAATTLHTVVEHHGSHISIIRLALGTSFDKYKPVSLHVRPGINLLDPKRRIPLHTHNFLLHIVVLTCVDFFHGCRNIILIDLLTILRLNFPTSAANLTLLDAPAHRRVLLDKGHLRSLVACLELLHLCQVSLKSAFRGRSHLIMPGTPAAVSCCYIIIIVVVAILMMSRKRIAEHDVDIAAIGGCSRNAPSNALLVLRH